MSESDNWRECFWYGTAVLADFERLRFEGTDDCLLVNGLVLSDEIMEIIGSLRTLRRLQLCSCDFTETGVGYLSNLAGLDTLVLKESSLTDNGLSRLTLLTNITWLDVRHTFLTDSGLQCLTDFAGLSTLMLSIGIVSGAAIRGLLPRLPDCVFLVYGGPFKGHEFSHRDSAADDLVELDRCTVDERFSADMQMCLQERVAAIARRVS